MTKGARLDGNGSRRVGTVTERDRVRPRTTGDA